MRELSIMNKRPQEQENDSTTMRHKDESTFLLLVMAESILCRPISSVFV